MRRMIARLLGLVLFVAPGHLFSEVLIPRVEGEGWQVAGNPDLGSLSSPEQQPVDFGIWRAADGSWQIWSCIRKTREEGRTRLFHRWSGRDLLEPDWRPMGIAMRAKPELGETPGGLQAPFVIRTGDRYRMFYGDMVNICLATSEEGKDFERSIQEDGTARLFDHGGDANARDAMLLKIGGVWHGYYTADPDGRGAVYCRTTTDFVRWSEPKKVAFGGEAGTGPFAAECPFVVEPVPGHFYLFRTQRYGREAVTRVYHSTDPLNFGIDADEEHLVASLPLAAPEIVYLDSQYYIASLLPDLDGIRIQRLEWIPGGDGSADR